MQANCGFALSLTVVVLGVGCTILVGLVNDAVFQVDAASMCSARDGLLSDGRRIVFISHCGGHIVVAQTKIVGGRHGKCIAFVERLATRFT